MAPTAEQLLELAVEQIKDEIPPGKAPAATLGRRIGLPYQRVYRWFLPGNGPDYEGTMAILEAFGWLNMNGVPRKTASEDQKSSGRLAALLATIDDLATADEGILRRLEAVEKRVASTRRRASGE